MSIMKRLMPAAGLVCILLVAAACGSSDQGNFEAASQRTQDGPLTASAASDSSSAAAESTGQFDPLSDSDTANESDTTDESRGEGSEPNSPADDDPSQGSNSDSNSDSEAAQDLDPPPNPGSDSVPDPVPTPQEPAPGPSVPGPASESNNNPPVFTSFSVGEVERCSATDPTDRPGDAPVTVSWSITGADNIYVAIDNEYGPYESGLPASGSLSVPGPGCEDNTYYVVATNTHGRTVRHAVRTAFPVEPDPVPVPEPEKLEILSFHVPTVEPCKAGEVSLDPITVSWAVAGADEVYVAIDNEYGPYESGLPASGSLTVPAPGCGEGNDYYLVITGGGERVSSKVTRTG